MPNLTSPHNPLIKEIRKAVHRGSLTSSGLAVAEGIHLLQEAQRSKADIEAVVASELSQSADQATHLVSDEVFQALSGTENTQGVLSLVRPRACRLEDIFQSPALAVVLEGLQDPGNAGSIMRSAEAFGASGLVFLKGSVNPYNPKSIRASAGSVFRLNILAAIEPRDLPAGGVQMRALMPHSGTTLDQVDWKTSCAIVVGNEGRGVTAEFHGAQQVRIPTAGVESLNAALAAGIVLYEARRQRTQSL